MLNVHLLLHLLLLHQLCYTTLFSRFLLLTCHHLLTYFVVIMPSMPTMPECSLGVAIDSLWAYTNCVVTLYLLLHLCRENNYRFARISNFPCRFTVDNVISTAARFTLQIYAILWALKYYVIYVMTISWPHLFCSQTNQLESQRRTKPNFRIGSFKNLPTAKR